MLITKQDALEYHNGSRPGKVEVVPTKPCVTQRDLSLAYTPGVAVPCKPIRGASPFTLAWIARNTLRHTKPTHTKALIPAGRRLGHPGSTPLATLPYNGKNRDGSPAIAVS